VPDHAERAALIAALRALPAQVTELTANLTDSQLDARPPDEWSVRQNVHHLADSHMNAFIRLKLALTEERPTIKPYDQNAWAETVDGAVLPLEDSLAILRGLHARWAALFESLSDTQYAREWIHPERGVRTVESLLSGYVEHGQGHLKQIREALAATA
jgi:hypothetical protein